VTRVVVKFCITARTTRRHKRIGKVRERAIVKEKVRHEDGVGVSARHDTSVWRTPDTYR